MEAASDTTSLADRTWDAPEDDADELTGILAGLGDETDRRVRATRSLIVRPTGTWRRDHSVDGPTALEPVPLLEQSDDAADTVLVDGAGDLAPDRLNQTLRESLRVLKGDGLLIIATTSTDLSDEDARAERTRIVTALHTTAPPGTTRLERVEPRYPEPGRRTVIVARKAERSAPAPAGWKTGRAAPALPFVRESDMAGLAPGMRLDDDILVRDFGRGIGPVRDILLLQLAHFGDFIIALPALREIRAAFPQARIRLVCGHWNVPLAQASGVVDEVRGFNYFPEHPRGWNGVPVQDMATFDDAARGRFDLAVDMRVDDDTRHLLGRVDARLRCGIGSQRLFPMLDVALPTEHSKRANTDDGERTMWLPANRFTSRLPQVSLFQQKGSLTRKLRGHVVYGPYVSLPHGSYTASFDVSVAGPLSRLGAMMITLEVVREGTVLASRSFRWGAMAALGGPEADLTFDGHVPGGRYEFRIMSRGYPFGATIRFAGVRLTREETAIRPNFRPVEVHIGEQLSLLVALVRARTLDVYAPEDGDPPALLPATLEVAAQCGPGPVFVLAPVSNSTIRNWPLQSYVELTRMLLRREGATVVVLGAPSQTAEAAAIVEGSGDAARVVNLVGRTKWTDLPDILRLADLVVCNNSGIAHQAASLGRPTLAVYSGSHQPPEWGPRGPRSRAIMAPVGCSPCGLEVLEQCMHQHACMTHLTPEIVLGQVDEMLAAYPPRVRA